MSGEKPIRLYRRTKRPRGAVRAREIDFFADDVHVSAIVEPNLRPKDAYYINNLDVLQRTKRGLGYGTAALDQIIKIAKRADASTIVAREVLTTAEGFWRKNKFRPVRGSNPTNDYVFRPK